MVVSYYGLKIYGGFVLLIIIFSKKKANESA